MTIIIEEVTEVGCMAVGEGPHWDDVTQSLYFVDVFDKSIHKYIPSTKQHTKLQLDKCATFIIPVQGSSDQFVISLKRDICIITWDGVSTILSDIKVIATLDTHPEGAENKINDAKVDAFGNLWTGTMNVKADIETFLPVTGAIYSISKKKVKKHLSDIFLSNGLAWNKDSNKFYYIDSGRKAIDQFDYDPKNLVISNRQALFSFEKHNICGIPDGQTIDENGNLWVATFGGQKVLNVSTKSPESLLGYIDMPEALITSVCFGGKNMDELYVTSCGYKNFEKDATKVVKGALYKVTGLGVKGLPAERFKL